MPSFEARHIRTRSPGEPTTTTGTAVQDRIFDSKSMLGFVGQELVEGDAFGKPYPETPHPRDRVFRFLKVPIELEKVGRACSSNA